MFVFSYLDEQYAREKGAPFFKLLHSQNVFKMMSWGIIEQATGYVLYYILPVLLAFKHRTTSQPATMAGTIIGILTAFSCIVAEIAYSVFD